MKRARPFEGSVDADGIIVHARRSGERDVTGVIARLDVGDRALSLGADVIVVFAQKRRLRTELAHGSLVVRTGPHLMTFTCVADEISHRPHGTLLRLVAGEIVSVPLTELTEIPARELFVLPTTRVHQVSSLGRAPSSSLALAAPAARSVREVLGIPQSEAQREFLASLARAPRRTRPVGVLAGVLRRALAFVARLWTIPAPTPRGGPSKKQPGALAAPRKPSWLDRLIAPLSRTLLMLERLTGRQARYLADLLEELDRGDFERALRHAIPLGSGDGEESGRVALGVPQMRAELRIDPHARGPSSTMSIEGEQQTALRQSYERAFVTLDRAGRHQEAAFVLAELLRDHARAVDYLEKRGRFDLAAEIAETRGLPADRVIALFMLAKLPERAMAIARRTGAFTAAMDRLERGKHTEAAAALRLEHADLLARAGDYLHAVSVVWRVDEARPLARAWLARLLDEGGLAAARAWAMHLALDGATVEDVRTRLIPELSRTDEDGARFRAEFASQGATERLPPLGVSALKVALRGMLCDRLETGRDLDALIKRVTAKIADPVLTADTPTLSPKPPLRTSTFVRFGPLDVGGLDILDAVTLPDGRHVVALGENGIRLVSPLGKTLLRFDQPATGLVLDDRGMRVIAVAPRADTVRFARIDLLTKRAAPWFELPCYLVAGSFDGESLFVVQSDDAGDAVVTCLDAIADEPIVLHAVSGLDDVWDISRSATALRVVILYCAYDPGDDAPFEFMHFELPQRTLRISRAAKKEDRVAHVGNAVSIQFNPYRLGFLEQGGTRCLIWKPEQHLIEDHDGDVMRPVLELAGATRVRMRAHGAFVTVSDDRGRIITLDRQTLAFVRSVLLT